MSVSITNCDLEPIHQLGNIQPQGFLMAFSRENNTLEYISDNFCEFSEIDSESLLGKSLEEIKTTFYGADKNRLSLAAVLHDLENFQKENFFDTRVLTLNGKDYYEVIHEYEGRLIAELEQKYTSENIFSRIYGINSRLIASESKQELLNNAAKEIRDLIGYERVLVYKFLKDGSGETVAESALPGHDEFIGLRFPESDIPKQARELYKINKVRIITDASARDVPVLSRNPAPLDLTYSILRSVSRMHIQYLMNMGVQSSFSISIIHNGKLWGLIACHNSFMLPVDFEIRNACKMVADIVAQAITYQTQDLTSKVLLKATQQLENFRHNADFEGGLGKALVQSNPDFKEFIQSDCAVAYISGVYSKSGHCPDEHFLRRVIKHVLKQSEKIWETDSLKIAIPDLPNDTGICGVLACRLNTDSDDVLLWFRREVLKNVRWAGEPTKEYKAVTIDGIERQEINPRKSFQSWRESVTDHSEPWTETDIHIARNLSGILLDISFRRNQLLEKSNIALQVAISEMDNFVGSVNHELSNPLTSIGLNIHQLKKTVTEPHQQKLLETISAQYSRINKILTNIGSLSEIKKLPQEKTEIEMPLLIFDILEEITGDVEFNRTKRIIGQLENIYANEISAYQIFRNVIVNAVKYCSKKSNPVIEISSKKFEDRVEYLILDNGIGIAGDSKDIFEAFIRDENATTFKGTGMGLNIVKNLILRENGSIRYVSCMTEGTCFYLTFPNPSMVATAVTSNDSNSFGV